MLISILSELMPEVYLRRNRQPETHPFYTDPNRPEGLIADTPDESGTYTAVTGDPLTIDMSEVTKGRIKLVCPLFVGHLRIPSKTKPAKKIEEPYYGSSERVLELSQAGKGAINLSYFERLEVKLHTNLAELQKLN